MGGSTFQSDARVEPFRAKSDRAGKEETSAGDTSSRSIKPGVLASTIGALPERVG